MQLIKRMMLLVLVAVLIMGYIPVRANNVHVVVADDVLWRIAQVHGLTWEVLASYNQLDDPHHIEVGQRIYIPTNETAGESVIEQLEVANYEVIIGGTWPVGGTLSMPAGASATNPVPGVILVHGSGASNRDAAVLENRPFYDIALYLSTNGVAVLRYDKTTYVHGEAILAQYGAAFTVWEETIESALNAARLLQDDPRINHVYMIGLSLGAMLAPRIHNAGGDFDGLIFMAGTPRTMLEVSITQNWLLFDIIYAQVEEQAFLLDALIEASAYDELRIIMNETAVHMGLINTSEMTDQEIHELTLYLIAQSFLNMDVMYASIMEIEALLLALPDMSAEEAQTFLFDPAINMYAYYLRDFALNPTANVLRDIQIPMLFLQGALDFQILVDEDFNAFYELVGYRDNTTFILYEGLGHIFTPSTATHLLEAMAEWQIPAQVCPQVLSDMLQWILVQS